MYCAGNIEGPFMNRPAEQPSENRERDSLYEEAVHWFMALRAARSNPPADDVQAAFERWQAADPAHARAYARCRSDWEELEPLTAIYRHADIAAPKAALPNLKRLISWKQVAGLAATVGAIVTVGLLATAWFQPVSELTVSTKTSERKTVQLEDGSHIELNARSRLHVAYFRNRRAVDLQEGEALFDVRHDPSRPFSVEAGLGTVEVVGTSFQVTRHAEDLTVAVLRGDVRVVGHDPSRRAIALTTAHSVRVTRNGAEPVQAISVKTVGAWRNNILIFDRSPLRDVVPALQSYYDGTIQLDARAQDIPLTAVVQLTDIESTLTSLPASIPVHLDQPSSKQWIIRLAKS